MTSDLDKASSRVSKDTSSRKNIIPSTTLGVTHSGMEVKAIQAAHKAYLDAIVTGYEEQIKIINTTHAEAFESIKASWSKQAAQIEAKAQKAKDEGFSLGLEQGSKDTLTLRSELDATKVELRQAKASLAETTANHEQSKTELSAILETRDKQITRLQANVAMKLVFKPSNRSQVREFFFKRSTPFQVAVDLLRSVTKPPKDTEYEFVLDGRKIERFAKTMEQLNIVNGQTIVFTAVRSSGAS